MFILPSAHVPVPFSPSSKQTTTKRKMLQICHILSLLITAIAVISVQCTLHSDHRHAALHALRAEKRGAQARFTMAARVNQSAYWLDAQDHTGPSRGYAPFIAPDYTYPVYRNVRSYGAVGDGVQDDADSLQNAINTDGQGGNRYRNEVTTRPALVFVPGGEYKISKTVDLRLNTILVGDPNNPPVFKATAEFSAGSSLINGYDFATDGTGGTTNFFVAVKNIVIDTTNVDKNKSIVALNWGVAQACQSTNVKIRMPRNSHGHIGIALDQGSTIALTDVVSFKNYCNVKTWLIISAQTIIGGAIGIRNRNQQVNFKNISFYFCNTAIAFTGGFTSLIQGAKFDTCGLGIDATGGGQLGSVIILDSTSINSGPLIKFRDSSKDNGDRNNQIVIENLCLSGNNPVAVASDGGTKLQRIDPAETWIWGNVAPGNYQTGKVIRTARSGKLLANGKFFTKAQPNYKTWAKEQVVNVKAVSGHP